MAESRGEIVRFGPFRLVPTERLLDRNGRAVAIGSRRLDILIVLVERAGEVISQRELLARAWPNLVVEKANLRIHVAGLRKVLGDGVDGARYITNVPGRGYCFVAPVWRCKIDAAAVAGPAPFCKPGPPKTLPAPPARLVGCENAMAALTDLLREKRFVSIVGPGGIGKTATAVALAHALFAEFGDAVFFADLGLLTDETMVAAAVASALGISMPAPDPLNGLPAFAEGKRLLLVIDNCEHVIDAAAALAERIFNGAPDVCLLATSREPLRACGEHVYLLQPLACPPDSAELSAEQALASPAVQLFMERAAAGGHRAPLSDADAPMVAWICRRLDGIALAVELAAGRVGAYGLHVVADLLDRHCGLPWQGRRTALPRHRSLRAMLDWSYALLSPRERQVLCRLSVFIGDFTFEAAHAVAGDADMDARQVAATLGGLIEKSLIRATAAGGKACLRLSDITRMYAADKLAETLAADAAGHDGRIRDPIVLARVQLLVLQNQSGAPC